MSIKSAVVAIHKHDIQVSGNMAIPESDTCVKDTNVGDEGSSMIHLPAGYRGRNSRVRIQLREGSSMIHLPAGCRGRSSGVKIQLREGLSVEGGIVELEYNYTLMKIWSIRSLHCHP